MSEPPTAHTLLFVPLRVLMTLLPPRIGRPPAQGAIVLFRTGLTVMAMLKDPLMERDDATEIYILLSRVPKHLLCIDAFMPT